MRIEFYFFERVAIKGRCMQMSMESIGDVWKPWFITLRISSFKLAFMSTYYTLIKIYIVVRAIELFLNDTAMFCYNGHTAILVT
jgi:hypothetical protein